MRAVERKRSHSSSIDGHARRSFSRSTERRESRFSKQQTNDNRSDSRQRSSRRAHNSKSVGRNSDPKSLSETTRDDSTSKKMLRNKDSDDDDEIDESGGNWWEHHPPYATRRNPSNRGRHRGGTWQSDTPSRTGGPEGQNDFRDITDSTRFPPGSEIQMIPRPHPTATVRPFPRSEDGRPLYGRPELVVGSDALPPVGVAAAWMQSPAFGGPAAWRALPPRFSSALDPSATTVSVAPPPPPPSVEEDEGGTSTIQLRPRQDDTVDSSRRGVLRLPSADEKWNEERKFRASLVHGNTRNPAAAFPGVPRPMLPPGMWHQQPVPHHFGAASIDPNLLLLRQGRPPMLQHCHVPTGPASAVAPFNRAAAVAAARRGRMMGGAPPIISSQGPLMMLQQQQAVARRRLEATDGRYLDAEIDVSGQHMGVHLSPQDRQEEELVEELQTFLDLELSKGIKTHSFFTRVTDKLEDVLLTDKTVAQISAIVPPEANFHPNPRFGYPRVRENIHLRSVKPPVLKFAKRRLFSLAQKSEIEPVTKKRRHLSTKVAEFFPDTNLSSNLAFGVKEMPFNILVDSESREAKDNDDIGRQKARLNQFIASRRIHGSLYSSALSSLPEDWTCSTFGAFPASCYTQASPCPTYFSLGRKFEEASRPVFGEFDLSDTFLSFHSTEQKFDSPPCLSSAFTCRLNSDQSHSGIMSFRSVPPSSSDRIVDNLSVERTLAKLVSL